MLLLGKYQGKINFSHIILKNENFKIRSHDKIDSLEKLISFDENCADENLISNHPNFT